MWHSSFSRKVILGSQYSLHTFTYYNCYLQTRRAGKTQYDMKSVNNHCRTHDHSCVTTAQCVWGTHSSHLCPDHPSTLYAVATAPIMPSYTFTFQKFLHILIKMRSILVASLKVSLSDIATIICIFNECI